MLTKLSLALLLAVPAFAEGIVLGVKDVSGAVVKRHYYGAKTWGIKGSGIPESGRINFEKFSGEEGAYRVFVSGVLEADGRASYVLFKNGLPVQEGRFPYLNGNKDCGGKGAVGEFRVGRFEMRKGDRFSLWIKSVYECGAQGAYGLTESLRLEKIGGEQLSLSDEDE